MYNLSDRVKLITISTEDHSAVAVVSEDCSVAEAFGLAREASSASVGPVTVGSHTYQLPRVEPIIVPLGFDWSSAEVGAPSIEGVYWFDDDNTRDVTAFVGDELGWSQGSTIIWEDGAVGAEFVPCD